MDLRALSDFVLVAGHGGFAEAARLSGQSKATLSRRVRGLEQDLGFRLFDRDTRAMRLTEEGERLFNDARWPLLELAEAEGALRAAGDEPRGLLRVSAPILFCELAIGAIAAAYLKRCPAVRLEVIAEDRMASPIEEGIDVVLRVDPKPESELVGRCILKGRDFLVGAPGPFAQARGVFPSVVLTANTATTWRLEAEGTALEVAHAPMLRVSSLLAARQAVLAGLGVAALPNFMVADDLASGRLVKLGVIAEREACLWALQPSRRLASRRVTSFLDHLAETFPGEAWPSGGFDPPPSR